MTSTLVEAPAAAPVTLAEAKAHLRVTHAHEDALIGDLIAVATRFLADNDGICAIRQTWRYYISNPRHAARINRYPVIGITDAIGYDTSGNASALSASDITLDHRTRPADLSVNADVSSQAANGLDVDIEFGFGDTGVDVPEPIKRAILVLVAHWYAFRAEVMPSQQPVSLPAQYDRLIAPYRHRGLCA